MGFKLTKIENPYSYYASQPDTLDAVVLILEEGKERIIKMKHLGGKVGYSHQKFNQKTQRWRSISHPLAKLKEIKNLLTDKNSKNKS